MKKLFEKVEVKNRNILSKAEKKKYNPKLGDILDMKTDYTVITVSTKLKLVKDNSGFLFFDYFGTVIPAIKSFNSSLFKTIWLDSGALGPISRGADVMVPGIIKFIEKCPSFHKDEILGVEIEGQGIFAVGIALMSYDEMVQKKEGPVIDILHVKGDSLDKGEIY